MNPNAFTILKSIPDIGSVWAIGILSEIGDITAFHSSDALAKYAGLTWLKNDSGDFISEDHGILYTVLHKQIISSLIIIPFYETDVNLFICRTVTSYKTSQSSLLS